MRSQEERRKVFEENGVDLNKDIATLCNGGVSASVLYASLADIAKGNLAVYDGSWSEFNSKK
jgi:thiosulfate/3-mercaptopyruvate sulfurtransferase